MSPEKWDKLLEKRDVQCVSELREGRYNAVYHLVTAAEGAEQFYTLENNAVRTETPELARELDNMTRTAWVGHPNLKIFDNSTSFEEKLQRVVEETAKLVGVSREHSLLFLVHFNVHKLHSSLPLQLPAQMQRVTTKFLLKREPDFAAFPDDVKYQIFDVEKVCLTNLNWSTV